MVGVGRGAHGRRSDQECRGARALGENRHAGRRQDRDADRRQAARRRGACRPRVSTTRTVLSLARQSRTVERASARGRDRCVRPKQRRLELTGVADFDFDHRQGRHRHGRAAARSPSATPSFCTISASRPTLLKRASRRSTARRRDSDVCRRRRPAGRPRSPSPIRSRRRRRRRLRALRGGRHPHRHADRRQPHHRAGRGAQARHHRDRGRSPARAEKRDRARACAAKGAWSRWPATASTTRRRLPRPTSASRWAPARMSRSRAPASRWSKAISPASRARGALSRATMRNIRQNLVLRLCL